MPLVYFCQHVAMSLLKHATFSKLFSACFKHIFDIAFTLWLLFMSAARGEYLSVRLPYGLRASRNALFMLTSRSHGLRSGRDWIHAVT